MTLLGKMKQLMLFDPNPEGPLNTQARVKGTQKWYSFGNMTNVRAAEEHALELADKVYSSTTTRIYVETREESVPEVVYDLAVDRVPEQFVATPFRKDED